MDRTEAQLRASIAIIDRYGVREATEIMREIRREEDDCAVCGELHAAVVKCIACGAPCCLDALGKDERDHCKHCEAQVRDYERRFADTSDGLRRGVGEWS